MDFIETTSLLKIEVERTAKKTKVNIFSARPGRNKGDNKKSGIL